MSAGLLMTTIMLETVLGLFLNIFLHSDAQVAHSYSDLIRVHRRVVAEPVWYDGQVSWMTQHALAKLYALSNGSGNAIYS